LLLKTEKVKISLTKKENLVYFLHINKENIPKIKIKVIKRENLKETEL